jgi:hypothetical protein
MVDADETSGSNTQRNLWMILCGIGIVMLLGAITGFLSQHNAQGGGPMDVTGLAVLAAFVTVILLLAFTIWKLFQKVRQSGETVPRREKLYNRIMIGCGLLGGAVGLALAMTDNLGAEEASLFASGPISPILAIILSIAIGVVMPAISIYWHKHVVDEQEDAAYRSGALIAIYAFWFVAPVWWLLWRGGMLPAPNGVAIYLMTTFVALIVWFWKKYR